MRRSLIVLGCLPAAFAASALAQSVQIKTGPNGQIGRKLEQFLKRQRARMPKRP